MASPSTTWARVAGMLLACMYLGAAGDATAQSTAPSRLEPEIARGTPPVSFTITIPLGDASRDIGGLSPRAIFEIGGVVLTGAGHLAFSAIDASAVFIALASAGWGSYVYYRARTEPGFLSRAGFTAQRLGPAFRDASFVAAGSLALMAGVGLARGALVVDTDMIPLMLLYPTWGLVQQFLVQGLVAGNLAAGNGWIASPYTITATAATLFGAVHLPSLELAGGTFALALAYTPLYLKHRNLWPLGLYHGWLGAFYYFWVLERNPWQTVIG